MKNNKCKNPIFRDIIVFIFLIWMIGVLSLAQAQLAFNIGSSTIDYCKDVAVDSSGNIILAGYFSGTVDFDSSPNIRELTAVGITDNFLAKYDRDGNYLWAFRTGGAAADLPHSVVVDALGNIYTAGYFTGTNVDFDPGTGQSLHTSNGGWDCYVAKYTSGGVFLWAATWGNTADDETFDLRVDSTGNVYVIGSFEGTINMGGTDLTSAGGRDIFIAKYSSIGNHLWSKSFGSTGADNGYAVTVDSSGNVYASGGFTGSVSVGGTNLNNAGGTDIFLAKYDTNGNHLWSESMGGTSSADMTRPGGIEIDSQNRLYICGSYGELADFNPDPGVTKYLTSTGSGNFFVARYNQNGAYIWAIGIGGTGTNGSDGAHRMAIDSNGDVYVTGFFTDQNVDFDPGSGTALLSANGTGSGVTDIFLAKYTVNGAYAWAHGYGAVVSGTDLFSLGGGIELDPDGNVFVAGRFYGTLDWDPGTGQELMTTAGQSDGFLVKFKSNGDLWTSSSGLNSWKLY